MAALEPLCDRILVKRDAATAETPGGIILPENAREKPRCGTVVAVGPGRQTEAGLVIPVSLREGDRIMFTSHGGLEIEIDGEAHVIMREDDVLGRMS